jgi:hypothetical protein
MQLERRQERGGRKGGLPICDQTVLLVRTSLSAALAGDEKAMPENPVAVKLKHVSAQAAMHAPSSAALCVLSLGALWWWWSQSGIVSAANISVAVVTPAAKPIAAGSIATDRATTIAKMVWPMRIFILYWSEIDTILKELIAQNSPSDIDQDQILATAQDRCRTGPKCKELPQRVTRAKLAPHAAGCGRILTQGPGRRSTIERPAASASTIEGQVV